ncbi:MAG TPA: hypothetical protein VG245_01835 [Candidatus Dormibacteraeota bacterium]|jgi:hypothetical protein|nr:hypothetical protein [Candidatus Dormibacteraeota bacterium]
MGGTHRRLGISRETVRELSSSDLRVAGGQPAVTGWDGTICTGGNCVVLDTSYPAHVVQSVRYSNCVDVCTTGIPL